MKLYEIPKGSKIKAETTNDKGEKLGDFITFHRIDGAYSFCTIEDTNEVCHLHANTDLEKVGDYYEILSR